MNTYEGLFIFQKSLNDEALDEALGEVRKEIERAGRVQSVTRLGKRGFARPIKKQDAGYYAVVVFDLPGDQVGPLQARWALMERLVRAQVVRAEPVRAEETPPEDGGKEKD